MVTMTRSHLTIDVVTESKLEVESMKSVPPGRNESSGDESIHHIDDRTRSHLLDLQNHFVDSSSNQVDGAINAQ
jgi:hypothetical protein